MATPDERFKNKYKISLAGCWEWKATSRARAFDYGKFWYCGRYEKAHRASYMMFVGEIPEGLCVLHRCDNPPCVNPAHLFVGSKRDNALDMLAKGRGGQHKNPNIGDRRKDAKLTTQKVLDIRRLCGAGMSQGNAAKMFGVGQPTIFKVVHRHRWAHV
jgi:hypothetical protein